MRKNEFYEKKDVSDLRKYDNAVEAIKTAILQGQYEAAKGVNRIQLAVYFGIGKYISLHTRKGVWGTGALEVISQRLRKELPGLRGYSATQLKKMRLFYENWIILDSNSSVTTDDNSTIAIDELSKDKSSLVRDEFKIIVNQIDVYNTLKIPNVSSFPVEDFFRVPFTHHVEIFTGVKNLEARYYYIHRTAEEHLSVTMLIKLIKDNVYANHQQMPNNFVQSIPDASTMRKAVMMFKDSYFLDFINVEQIGERESIDVDERVVEQRIGIVLCKSANREYVEFVIRDYNKPMGVATYKTLADMPEEYRKALPDVEELKRIVQG